jgi:hypothetical protein
LWSIHPKYLDAVGLVALWRNLLCNALGLVPRGNADADPHVSFGRFFLPQVRNLETISEVSEK